MKRLRKALIDGSFLLDLDEHDMVSILRRALDFVTARGVLPTERADEVEARLLERELQVSTAIGNAVAVPHTYLSAFSEPVIVFVRLSHPTNLGAPDGVPTRFLFVLLGPSGAQAQHLDTLANIARLMADDEFRYDASVARTQLDLLAALDRFDARTAPPPTPRREPAPQPLTYTGRLFGGLIDDVRRRAPHYAGDFRDGLHTKCLASTLFLFFACVAPAVTFGGIMGQLTGNQIGAIEMLVASAVCGIVYALFSGQPLIILGGTGPLLVFTAILYRLCVDLQIPFLPTYTWVGLWTSLLLLVLAATEASCLMRYFTRFTNEIFAALISIIFIYEAIKGLVQIYTDTDVPQQHATYLLSLLLALGTFFVALSLARFRSSRYLRSWIREFLADFGPAIALGVMALAAVVVHDVYLDVLTAPESFATTSGRPWLINPLDAPMWVRLSSVVPAVLLTVLVYLDQNITARLVNSPEHKLHKGEAYHLDVGIVGLLVGACSLVGLPWLVAATVRSLNHVRSLATVESVVSKSGEMRERVIHVRENRITPLAIHVLIGLSLLLLPLLKIVPMAVLYGLFLYMGVVSIVGNQFFDRLKLWFIDPMLYPTVHYVRKVPQSIIHKFTLLQFACLSVLWVVKASVLGLLFPLFIAALVPIRLIAGRFFAPEHLAALDSDEVPEEEETRWV